MRIFLISSLILMLSICAAAQKPASSNPQPAAENSAKVYELSKAALAAHGGGKLKALKSLVVRGSVDITTSAITQAIPATFATVIAGDRYMIDIENPFQPLKQVYDGKETFSSIKGFSLPPVTSLGFPLLVRLGDEGFALSELPETGKKRSGFRITSPDGFYTDFYLDDRTKLVKSYESSYNIGGRSVTTSVEVDKYRIVDGISIPERYSQRFDLGQMTAYASFKARDILVNSPIDDDVFVLGK